MQVLILGYGEMGHAMEALLAPRHDVAIWEKYPAGAFVSVRLKDAAPAADFVIFCLPANPHREVLKEVAPWLAPECLCISVAKGLDDSGATALDVFREVLGVYRGFALLHGPMIAEELQAGRYGFAQAGCPGQVFERVRELFAGSRLCLSHSDDPRGTTWSVILKNVYAIGFGVADGLEMGDNVRGFLMVRALHELGRIVADLGGNPRTSFELAGLGDLTTTATSSDSHHHALGTMLARGQTDDISGEGIHTLATVVKHGLLDVERYPLFAAVHAVVNEPTRAAEHLERYIASCGTASRHFG